jgi:hypothetical protein
VEVVPLGALAAYLGAEIALGAQEPFNIMLVLAIK